MKMKELKPKDEITEFLLYKSPNGDIKVEVFLHNETVWLTQKKMSELFGVGVPAISKHLDNIFNEGELDKDSTVSFLEIVQNEGGRAVKKIQEELKEKNKQSKLGEEKVDLSKLDFGFRVLRLYSSNMKDVYYNPEEINQTTLIKFKDNIKEDRTDKDLLYQVLLDLAKLNPLRLVFKDSSFKDDSAKVNVDEYLKHKLPGYIVKVI